MTEIFLRKEKQKMEETNLELEIEELSEEEYQKYLASCLEICEEPLCVNHCMHGLWMGTKRA